MPGIPISAASALVIEGRVLAGLMVPIGCIAYLRPEPRQGLDVTRLFSDGGLFPQNGPLVLFLSLTQRSSFAPASKVRAFQLDFRGKLIPPTLLWSMGYASGHSREAG